jgi:hypothetical protein
MTGVGRVSSSHELKSRSIQKLKNHPVFRMVFCVTFIALNAILAMVGVPGFSAASSASLCMQADAPPAQNQGSFRKKPSLSRRSFFCMPPKTPRIAGGDGWWACLDLNQGPLHYQCNALTN